MSDEWSSYWYNGRIYSNSGLNRRGEKANRGLDVYRLTGELGRMADRATPWSTRTRRHRRHGSAPRAQEVPVWWASREDARQTASGVLSG